MDKLPPLLRQAWREHWRLLHPHRTPLWLQLSLTLAVGLLLGLLVAVIAGVLGRQLGEPAWWRRTLPVNTLIIVWVSYCFQASGLLLRRLLPEALRRSLSAAHDWRAAVLYTTLSMISTATGFSLGLISSSLLYDIDLWAQLESHGSRFSVPQFILTSIAISIVLSLIQRWRNRQQQLRLQATEAQLRLLQAQIEPHFLFNTLANVQSLIDYDTPRAKQMLESFTDYLRASLQQLRRQEARLQDELSMAEAYLTLMQTRMQDRLRFRIEVPDALRDTPLPPMLLQPLIENAIHHGLEPKLEGGEICISAEQQAEQLLIRIDDDGLGLDAPKRRTHRGNGVALDNIRERLRARYGRAAVLNLQTLTPGTRAELRLPLDQ